MAKSLGTARFDLPAIFPGPLAENGKRSEQRESGEDDPAHVTPSPPRASFSNPRALPRGLPCPLGRLPRRLYFSLEWPLQVDAYAGRTNESAPETGALQFSTDQSLRLRAAISRWISAAHWTASITLANSAKTPSPMSFTTRPWCFAVAGTISSERWAWHLEK
jgi:hypothetical protein